MTVTNNLAPLDGLRGIAIAAVFAFHIATGNAFNGIPWLQEIMLTGWLGVDLFFVISGFLITRSAINLSGKPGYYSKFYKARAWRILPAYFSVLAVLIVLYNVFYAHLGDGLALFNERIPCLVMMCTNLQTAFTSTATPFGVNHFWSLAIEVQIYLFWPIAVAMLSRKNLLFFAVAIALCSFGYRAYTIATTGNWIYTYFSTFTRLDSFAMGAAVFLISGSSRSRAISHWLIGIGLLGATITAFANSGIHYNREWSNAFGITFAAFICSGVVLAVTTGNAKTLSSLLSFKPLMMLGVISYSFYILHFPIMGASLVSLINPDWYLFEPSIWQNIAFASVLFSVCLLASIVSYFFLERPFLSKRADKSKTVPLDSPVQT